MAAAILGGVMRSLLELEAFSPIADDIRHFVDNLSSAEPLTLVIEPNRECAVASALIESALLDENIHYSRRFLPRQATAPMIIVQTSNSDNPITTQRERGRLTIQPFLTVGLRDSDGSPLKGRLSVTAQAAALARRISPSGSRTRKTRPWLLAGNWWGEGLDGGFDPVWSALLDHLTGDGVVRLSPVTAISDCDLSGLKHLDKELLASTRESWDSLGRDARSESLSRLVLPMISESRLSTARIEELVWKRIIVSSSKKELHTSLNAAREVWDGSPKSAGDLVELVISGEL